MSDPNTAQAESISFPDGSGDEDVLLTARESGVARMFRDVARPSLLNPAYDGPMGIFEGYGEYDDPENANV